MQPNTTLPFIENTNIRCIFHSSLTHTNTAIMAGVIQEFQADKDITRHMFFFGLLIHLNNNKTLFFNKFNDTIFIKNRIRKNKTLFLANFIGLVSAYRYTDKLTCTFNARL